MSEGSLRDRAYHYVQRKIISGEIPPGGKVSEQAIAEELGISRTPVRTAIHELETEGLLEQVPRYGTIVRKPERRDIVELFDLRMALECFSAGVAAEKISHEDLKSLETLCNRMYEVVQEYRNHENDECDETILNRFVDADMQFHLIILRSTGNRRIMKSVADSRILSECGRQVRQRPRLCLLATAWEGHRAVLDALKSGNMKAAQEAMADHIRFSKDHALKIFDRLQAEGDANDVWQQATM